MNNNELISGVFPEYLLRMDKIRIKKKACKCIIIIFNLL